MSRLALAHGIRGANRIRGAVQALTALPTYDEMHAILPTYGQGYHVIDDMTTATGWTNATHDTSKGFDSLRITATGGRKTAIKDFGSTAAVDPEHFFFVDLWVEDLAAVSTIRLVGYDSAGVLQFATFLNGSTHEGQPLVAGQVNRLKINRSDITLEAGGAWTAVQQLGIWLDPASGLTPVIYVGAIATASLRPFCTLWFDDALMSSYNEGFSRMQTAGLLGVNSIVSKASGPERMDPSSLGLTEPVMDSTQLQEIQTAGWDLLNHTAEHSDLTTLTEAEIEAELTHCRDYLQGIGAGESATWLAYPFGAQNATTEAVAAEVCALTRTTTSGSPSLMPRSWRLMRIKELSNSTTLPTMQGWVDTAIDRQEWLTIMIHGITDPATLAIQTTPTIFQGLLDYLVTKSADIDVLPISDIVARMRGEV